MSATAGWAPRGAALAAATSLLLLLAAPRTVAHCWRLWSRRPFRRDDVARLRALLRRGSLLHPHAGGAGSASFCHLTGALARCCGARMPTSVRYAAHEDAKVEALVREIGGEARRHVVFVLCDGLGSAVLEEHLAPDSFLRRHNDAGRLRAVFPSTTPAALTTLATGLWPGQHGMPGWDLRDHGGVDYPGEAAQGPVQLRALDKRVMDMRSRQPAEHVVGLPVVRVRARACGAHTRTRTSAISRPTCTQGFSNDSIFCAPPWAHYTRGDRRLLYISAYAHSQFSSWSQGQTGQGDCPAAAAAASSKTSTRDIAETVSETLGSPEGAETAVAALATGVDAVLRGIDEAEAGGFPSYIHLYTAHPDKHMHALGVEHEQVREVVRGIDFQLARLARELRARRCDSALIMTADHGHVTVAAEHMVALPEDVAQCLEYANIGVHGKGRHAYLHCRSGLGPLLVRRWCVSICVRLCLSESICVYACLCLSAP